MQTTRAAGRPARRIRVRGAVALGGAAALLGGLITATPAYAVAGAAFTTDESGTRVNQNHYAEKCAVYINGGPENGANRLSDGRYFFTVLSPGGQPNPNDGGDKVLYADSYADRTFTVTGGKITGVEGPAYASHPDGSTTSIADDRLVQLCRPGDDGNFRDTDNPGGVYILAVCALDGGYPVTPRACKYDAFKVATPGGGGNDPVDLVAIKGAETSYERSYTWDVEKEADKTSVSQLGGQATFEYTVTATRSGPSDSAFRVAGEVSVFNPNDDAVTGVRVTDQTLGVQCAVLGGSDTIAARGSDTFTYECLVDATAETTGTNVATVTWDRHSIGSPSGSATAEAPYRFADAAVLTSGASTDVTDSFAGGPAVVLAQGLTATTTLTSQDHLALRRTLDIPASNCLPYSNTATVTGDTDTATVQVCGPNRDGYTIGFWKNNSSKVITSGNAGAYCTAIKLYPAVLTGLACKPGNDGNTSTNAKVINSYIAKTMADGESSGTGVPMLKAQFLATTLNVQRTPALGSTNVLLTQPETAALGLPSCTPVSSVLSAADTTYASLSKTGVVLVKDVFDRINNNRQLTC